MGECFFCNTEVIWQSDFDAEELGREEEGIVSFYTCPECGSEYEVFQPTGGKE